MSNWIKRTTQIYQSDSEEEQQHEAESKVDTPETSEGESTRESSVTEEEDQDQDTEGKTSDHKQGGNPSKRPRKIHNFRKHKYRKGYKKMVKDSGKFTTYRINRLPFVISFARLLGLLYLAVLLGGEDLLLSDIIR